MYSHTKQNSSLYLYSTVNFCGGKYEFIRAISHLRKCLHFISSGDSPDLNLIPPICVPGIVGLSFVADHSHLCR